MSTTEGPTRTVVSLIAAMSDNRVIGSGNQVPWHLPDDLKHFKRVTTGHTVVMGRKTYESVGRALPNRRNIVVTRNEGFSAAGTEVVHGVEAALRLASGEGEVFVVGGEQIYRAALAMADRIYLTRVRAVVAGDTYFPEFEGSGWRLVEQTEHPADERHAYAMAFELYEAVGCGE